VLSQCVDRGGRDGGPGHPTLERVEVGACVDPRLVVGRERQPTRLEHAAQELALGRVQLGRELPCGCVVGDGRGLLREGLFGELVEVALQMVGAGRRRAKARCQKVKGRAT